jgi:hypothetical protein
MGSEKAVLPDRIKPVSEWTRALSRALATDQRKSLNTPDYRFVDYPYQRPGWLGPHLPQNSSSPVDQPQPIDDRTI